VERKQVFGSEAKLAGKGCQTVALCGGVFVFCLFKSAGNYRRSGFSWLPLTFCSYVFVADFVNRILSAETNLTSVLNRSKLALFRQ